MAQTIEDIEAEIIEKKESSAELAGLTSTSKLSIWRNWVFVFAACGWSLQKKQDAHKAEMQALIAEQKTHTKKWYATTAKAFQYGYSLVQDEDYYDNTGIDEDTIALAQIIKHSVTVDSPKGLSVKVATETGGELAPIGAAELVAFTTYMETVKDGGVFLSIVNEVADNLQLGIDIHYDPLVMAADGTRLDGTGDTTVKDAIDAYLKSLPFNGKFRRVDLTDKLQAVDGVKVPVISSALSKYGALPYASIDVEIVPDAGYLKLYDPADLTINYLPYANV